MTAILTVIAGHSVYHVSDRLVSTANLQPVDPAQAFLPYDSTANKSVVYVGKDCRLVLGYTGPSHIGKLTTDRWLAELIRGGEKTPEQSEGRWPPLGDMYCNELLELLSREIPEGLAISIGGYQDTVYGSVARLWTVYRSLVINSHEETFAVVIPGDAATPQTFREIEFEVNSAPRHAYTTALVRAMRKISSRNPLVGSDFMVVRVYQAQRRFDIAMHLANEAESPNTLMYTPLCLFPSVAMAPMRLSPGQSRVAIGPGAGMLSQGPVEDRRDCEIILNANRLPDNHLAFSEQARKGPPRP